MTRKHFQALAEVIKDTREAHGESPTLWAVAMSIAAVCKRDNPGFKRERFLRACGYDA